MKKTVLRFNDERVTRSGGNVFIDLGFEPAEAAMLALRSQLMIRIEQHLKSQDWTRLETAKRLGITQPEASKLKKGAWRDLSLDMLLTLAARAGLRSKLTFAA